MDSNTLFNSLGTFWTQFFNDRKTVRGLTIGQAEEAAQQHITLLEALSAYSVADCPVFQITKWLPIVIKKSEFNKAPFVFEPDGAVFGKQPASDKFYSGQVFNWGQSKTPKKNIFVYSPSVKLGSLGVIANRVINPTFTCSNGVEVYYSGGDIFFNFDIFENGYFPIAELVGENGTPVTYVGDGGEVLQDMFTVLWCYCAEVDTDVLYNTYGRIFDIKKTSSSSYKQLLEHLVYLRTDGPTIENITSIVLAFSGETPVQEQQETIEDIFTDDHMHIVVTDKNVYKIPLTKSLRDIGVGDVLYSGEGISDTVEYFDNLVSPKWWVQQIQPKLYIGQNVLLGNYNGQLYFENSLQTITTDPDGTLHFPVGGLPEDVTTFHDHLDTQAISSYFLSEPNVVFMSGDGLLRMDGEAFSFMQNSETTSMINPVDFLFTNFFKNNSALLKLNVLLNKTDAFEVFPVIAKLLPKHVWFLAAFTAEQEKEIVVFSKDSEADGTDETGQFPDEPHTTLAGKFVIGISPLDIPDNDSVIGNSTAGTNRLKVNTQTQTTEYAPGLSTREVRTIALLTAAV